MQCLCICHDMSLQSIVMEDAIAAINYDGCHSTLYVHVS